MGGAIFSVLKPRSFALGESSSIAAFNTLANGCSTTTKRIIAFSREKPGTKLRTAQLKEFGPDNVRWTADNKLITAGLIDNEPSCGGPPKTEAGIRCPRGYVVATIDPKTMTVTEIARGPATPAFTGTAIAMRTGNQLWLGSFFADRLAYRTLK